MASACDGQPVEHQCVGQVVDGKGVERMTGKQLDVVEAARAQIVEHGDAVAVFQ